MDEQEFILQARKLMKSIHCSVKASFMKIYEPYDLTPPQVSILYLLRDNKCEKVSNLSNALHTPDSNISAICNRLEKRGLITKTRDPNDQRVVYMKLTQKASEILSELELKELAQWKKLKIMHTNDMHNILHMLEKLNEIMTEVSKL